jgi:hypothetical protein
MSLLWKRFKSKRNMPNEQDTRYELLPDPHWYGKFGGASPGNESYS